MGLLWTRCVRVAAVNTCADGTHTRTLSLHTALPTDTWHCTHSPASYCQLSPANITHKGCVHHPVHVCVCSHNDHGVEYQRLVDTEQQPIAAYEWVADSRAAPSKPMKPRIGLSTSSGTCLTVGAAVGEGRERGVHAR